MAVLDFLFPYCKCMVCKRELNNASSIYLCDTCAGELPYNTEPIALVNEDEKQYFTRAFAPFQYDGVISKLILQLKYNDDGQVAELFAPFMAATRPSSTAETVLVPVPLCKRRFKMRGYNQSLVLANAVGRYLELPVDANVLLRVRETTIQKNLSPKQRAENLRDAFAIAPGADVRDKHFIIVDDVYTSGSTTNECAKTLCNAGAKSVNVLIVARV